MKISVIVTVLPLVLFAGNALNYLAQGDSYPWIWAGVGFIVIPALLYKIWSDAAKP